MTNTQFWIIFGLLAAILLVVLRIADGLKSAQSSVEKITSPVTNLLSNLGL